MERLLKEGVPGNVVVEPELKRELAWSYPLPLELALTAQGSEPPPTGFGKTLNVRVRAGSQSLVGIKVILLFANVAGLNPGTRLERETGANGEVSFDYNPAVWYPNLLMLEPKSGFWDWWQEFPQENLSIDLPALPKTGPIGWWHQVVGMQRYTRSRGEGIRIGVVDTGVGPHPYVEHVRNIGAIISGQYDPAAGQDAVGHGTHVSGLIGARPVEGSGDYCGIADGAEIICVRVFTPEGTTNQGDVAEAIDRLVLEHDVHLINLSLGGPQPSQIEQDAVRTALDYGTLCIAASGNNFSQPVMYPGAYPETAAVSAVGLIGAYPPSSTAAHSLPILPTQLDRIAPNGLFVADFSNIGWQTSCTAPGVGIISTVPSRPEVVAPYAAANGTSMATPIVCASLATVLSQDANYRALPSRVERTQWASAVLFALLRPLGLSPIYVGGGLVQAWPG
jgi:subtilisin family serine protease